MKLRADLSATINDLDGKPLPLGIAGAGNTIAHQLGDLLVLDRTGPCVDYLMVALDLRKSPTLEVTTEMRNQLVETIKASPHAVVLVKGQIVNALLSATEIK